MTQPESILPPRPTIYEFGKDHWSTFGYAECRCVDDEGVPDRCHMRCNIHRHPGLAHLRDWNPEHGTRLKGFISPLDTPRLQLPDHDDWDCVEDLEAVGLLKWEGTGINPVFQLTEFGLLIAAELRKHKANGGNFAGFKPSTNKAPDAKVKTAKA